MKLHKILGIKNVVGIHFGVECEVEGRRLPHGGFSEDIRVEEDGSLRNGLEYVFARPLKKKESIAALQSLFDAFKEAKTQLDYSFRTSTHVHVNVLDLEMKQIVNIIFLYSIVEDLFVNFCAEHRHGNRFCLRFKEAQNLYKTLMSLAEHVAGGYEADFTRRLSQNTLKYAALNMYTLAKYGTLEFRSLEGTNDLEKITKWMETIENLVNVASSFEDLSTLHEAFMNDPETMVDAIFTHKEFKFPGWKNSIEMSFSQSYPIVLKSKGMY